MNLYAFFRRNYFIGIILICLISAQCSKNSSSDLKSGDELEQEFLTPPDDAKPLVWWHWMDGNITKEGIREDLEWLHRIGVGGFQTFDIGDFVQFIDKRLVYMDEDWKDAFLFATQLSDSLGMEMGIAASPGFSESGGPWVEPKAAMKKYVWSETIIEGGKTFSGMLPHPPTSTGTFQNAVFSPRMAPGDTVEPVIPEYYADAAVIACRIPESDFSMKELKPEVTSSGGEFSLEQLTDGDLAISKILPSAPVGQKAWVQFEFASPVTIQSLTLVDGGSSGGFGRGAGSSNKTLEVSNDGEIFTKVIDITGGRTVQSTITFDPVTGKYFRYCLLTPQPAPRTSPMSSGPGMPGMGMFGGATQSPGTQIFELVLNTGARINRFEDKAAFAAVTSSELSLNITPEADHTIQTSDVMDITSQMQADGTLEWTAPEGKWAILRFGYSLLGTTNHPATVEATGLEVDKLSKQYVTEYFNTYLDQYKEATGGLMGDKGLKYVLNDSWEAGTQNWTDDMIMEFQKHRGYSMVPWMPVLTGRVVESSDASERFLWDFRRTLEEMVAEYHYDQLTEILNERGMGRYTESHEGGRALIADGMEVKRNADVPMSATWVSGGMGGSNSDISTRHQADVRESSSVSHIYGKKYIAAESLTSWGPAWGFSPDMLKPTADMEFACGLNRMVIHASPHQPVNDKIPGTSLGPFGQMFTRHETWAEQATEWISYLSRCSYMLQQGNFVADVAYLYGEGNNITALFGQRMPDVPAGYEYDFVNADALIHMMSVKDGNIVTPSGMNYKILALDQSTSQMTLPVLKKINEMVKAGATIVGNKPVTTPSLTDDKTAFDALANELWPDGKGEKTIGKGIVYSGYSIQEVLDDLNIIQDFTFTKSKDDSKLLYTHRNLGDIDIYMVNNRLNKKEDVDASFRVDGRIAEIWHPESGKIEQASYTIEEGVTHVQFQMNSNDVVFVVFRTKTDQLTQTIAKPQEQVLLTLDGPWTLSFQENRGAPKQVVFDKLTPWNENSNAGIRYFSGTGTYSKTINAPSQWFDDNSDLLIDLGDVKNLAEVVVNGESLGIAWKTPFRINIGNALKEGDNQLEIKVTNLWVNRLIGDEQPGIEKRYTFTGLQFYNAGDPLVASGLLGPVEIVESKK